MPKYTPWFSFDTPPVRPGIYNVSCRTEGQTGRWFAKFDGLRWSGWLRVRAGSNVPSFRGVSFDRTPNGMPYWWTWRGLTKEAKHA